MPSIKKTSIIETDDLLYFWKIFSKNWYIPLLFAIVSAVSSYFYTYKLPNIYAAKSQILLKSDDTYDYQSGIFKGLGYYQDYQSTINQQRVISSNDLIRKAVGKIKLDVSYFIVGRLKTTEVYNSMPFDFSIQLIDRGMYEQLIKFKVLNENQYQITYLKKEDEITKIFSFDKTVIDADFILTVKKNVIINDETILSLKEAEYLVQAHDINALVGKFKSSLSIENIEGTTILELTADDEIPDRAIAFLDTLSLEYINYTAESQYKINENTLINIDKQLFGVVDILDSLESDLENYKSEKSILNLDKQETEYFNELMGYDTKKRTTELWIQSLASLEKYILAIGASKDDKLLPPSFYISDKDDYLKTAINELYTMQMSRNRTLYGATNENTKIEELDQTANLLKQNMLVYITNSKKGLLEKISDYDTQIQDYTKIVKGIPKTQRGLLNIQRKVDVNEKMYMYLLEKRANTIIARAGILPQTSIIEAAHSVGIVAPNKMKNLSYFMLVGIVLSLIIIFVRTVFFSTFENMRELKKLTSLPVLGEIMLSTASEHDYLMVDKNPKAPITESFRTIRTNLEYLASEVESKVVLITSHNPGEGKTFCSINLATILAKANKKVLLMELDLHKPKIQKALNMSSDIGVSTVLIGKHDAAAAILPTTIENLSVILSGLTPPNASEIILSKRLEELFNYGRTHFDYIIVDTPPIGLITDALVIMKYADVSLFVLNAKFAKKQVISVVEEIVETNKLKNFGLILNGVKRKNMRQYYGYGYYNEKANLNG